MRDPRAIFSAGTLLPTLMTVSLSAFFPPLMALAQPVNEQFYGYLGNYPKNANPGWHDDPQGIARDASHWFITQTETIWKIPVGHDLGSVAPGGGILRRRLSDYHALAGYNHLGDPEHHSYGGIGYLVVPIESPDRCAGIAIFRGSTLDYVTHFCLPRQSHAPWCAVEPGGAIVSSDFDGVANLRRYRIDWAAVAVGRTPQPALESLLPLSDENGNSLTLDAVQGGVISPVARMIYLVADGIHVFNSAGRRVQRSINGLPNTPGYFRYEYDYSFAVREEPEGLTVWDLDDGRTPHIRGQLHVVLLDNDILSDDQVFLKHYGRGLFVDGNHGGLRHGTLENPFTTISAAHVAAWPGAQITIKTGSYPETLRLSKTLAVLADGGTVTIGR